ncbi:hypothetical protein [Corynebacterium dentalis]|uniref:hypothetical protein n=1 Tax=Corynebacterium dentalis TaxID=2014528 RepID=UPI002896404C|nr:hypothetical protein [Corynebacterium dentalis]
MTHRKTLLAAVMTVPLFLAACGSDEEGSTDASSTSASSEATQSKDGSETAASGESSAAPSSSEGQDPAKDPQDSAQGEQSDQSQEGSPAPANGEGQAPVPAAAGTGSEEDRQAITNLVYGMDDGGDNVGAFLTYTVDHSCSAYKERYGGDETLRQQADEAKNLTFTQIGSPKPTVTGVDNVQVNGDSASADVSSDTSTENLKFVREGGSWMFCN